MMKLLFLREQNDRVLSVIEKLRTLQGILVR